MQHRVAHWQLNSVGYERLPDPALSDRRGTPARETRDAGEREAGRRDRKSGLQDATARLPNLGLTKTQSSRWQRLASLPISVRLATEATRARSRHRGQPSMPDFHTRVYPTLTASDFASMGTCRAGRRGNALWSAPRTGVRVSTDHLPVEIWRPAPVQPVCIGDFRSARRATWTTAVANSGRSPRAQRTGQIDPLLPFETGPMNGRIARGAGVRGRSCERVLSDPLLPFPIRPGT